MAFDAKCSLWIGSTCYRQCLLENGPLFPLPRPYKKVWLKTILFFLFTFFQIFLSISSLLIVFPCNMEEKVSTMTNSQLKSAYWSTKFNVPPLLSLPTNPSAKPLWHSQCIQIGKVVTQELLCTPSICPKLNPFVITRFNGGSIKEMISTLPNIFPNTNPITTSNFTWVSTDTFLPILPLYNLLLKNFPIRNISHDNKHL